MSLGRRLGCIFAGLLLLGAGEGVRAQSGFFGAIAFDRETGRCTETHEQATYQAASSGAMLNCGPDCEIITWSQGSCVALAVGEGNGFGHSPGSSREDASWKAVEQCSRYAEGCEVRCWTCSSRGVATSGPVSTKVNTGAPGETPMQVTNSTGRTLHIYWRNSQDEEVFYKTLEPGQSYSQLTSVGYTWVARDDDDEWVAEHKTTRPNERFQIGGGVRFYSPASDFEVSMTLMNGTFAPVNVYWIDGQGRQIFYQTLAPLTAWTVQTFEKHLWLAKTQSGQSLDLYAARGVPTQMYTIADRRGQIDLPR